MGVFEDMEHEEHHETQRSLQGSPLDNVVSIVELYVLRGPFGTSRGTSGAYRYDPDEFPAVDIIKEKKPDDGDKTEQFQNKYSGKKSQEVQYDQHECPAE